MMQELDLKRIGQNIKILRLRQGMNQIQLADRLGVSQTHMSNLERGHVCINLKILVKLANIFECTADNILYLNESDTTNQGQEAQPSGGAVAFENYTTEEIQTLLKFIRSIQNSK